MHEVLCKHSTLHNLPTGLLERYCDPDDALLQNGPLATSCCSVAVLVPDMLTR